MINTHQMQCCACVEIDDLNEFQDNPEEALWSLLENDYIDDWFEDGAVILSDLPGHIIFTGIVHNTTSNTRPTYVQQFAAYLEANKLGRVTLSQSAFNRINHPDHKIMVGVWSPNQRAVTGWFNKRKKTLSTDGGSRYRY